MGQYNTTKYFPSFNITIFLFRNQDGEEGLDSISDDLGDGFVDNITGGNGYEFV